MPVYLQDISAHIPLFYVLIASLMVLSMSDKWYYLLLVPLVFCLYGIFYLSRPFNIYYSQSTKMYIKDLLLTVVLIVMFISLGLEPETHHRFQVIMRSVILMLMACLSFIVCFSSPLRNVYMRLLGFFLVFLLCIGCLTFVIHDEPMMRKGLYGASVGIMTFFLLFYWMSITAHTRYMDQATKKKTQQQQTTDKRIGFDLRQLPRTVKSRWTA